ncbi:MAG: 3-dehydroquinate synthase [Armatimonadota bacterium]
MKTLEISLRAGFSLVQFEPVQIPDSAIIVCDSNLEEKLKNHNPIIIPAGESSKNLKQYERLLAELATRQAKRKTALVAVGGGVIGDLAGFAAATYMRGIPFIQVPTTLLAMVDSSVGGKVGIDTEFGKNLVGAFYPADKVYVDTTWLESLPNRQWQSGMAEVLKYGFIMDPELASSLSEQPLYNHLDHRTLTMISKCIQHKKQVVEADEFETTGYRAILNFGHTVGHAIEKLTNYDIYTHGEAISVGMVIETKIGEKLGICDSGLSQRIEKDLRAHGLPTNAGTTQDVENIIQSMRGDKKSMRGELSMSLITNIGECKLVHDIPEALVQEVLREH